MNVLQNRVLRIIFRLPYTVPVEPTRLQHGVLTVDQISILQSLLFMYKFHYNLLPKEFSNFFHQVSSIHTYNTRFVGDYRSTKIHSSLKLYSLGFMGPRFWNTLPYDLRAANYITFKKQIRLLIVNMHLYDFLPFQ